MKIQSRKAPLYYSNITDPMNFILQIIRTTVCISAPESICVINAKGRKYFFNKVKLNLLVCSNITNKFNLVERTFLFLQVSSCQSFILLLQTILTFAADSGSSSFAFALQHVHRVPFQAHEIHPFFPRAIAKHIRQATLVQPSTIHATLYDIHNIFTSPIERLDAIEKKKKRKERGKKKRWGRD